MNVVRSGLELGMITPAPPPYPVPEPPALLNVSLMRTRNKSATDRRFGYRTFPPTTACIQRLFPRELSPCNGTVRHLRHQGTGEAHEARLSLLARPTGTAPHIRFHGNGAQFLIPLLGDCPGPPCAFGVNHADRIPEPMIG